MLNLITDREQSNVDRLKTLSAKGWKNMTTAEKAEWSGDPMTAEAFGYKSAVNIFPRGPYYSSGVELTYRLDHIVAKAQYEGSYLYAVSIVGDAASFEGKTLTLSVDSMYSTTGGTAQLAVYWHDDSGYEYAGASLTEAGSVTFTLSPNAQKRAYLALYVYVATDVVVSAGAIARYEGVMLESGSERHSFVPYTEILPTEATKGAYNHSDLNRVETAVAEISEQYGLGLTTKTDWGRWDVPQAADLDRYIVNIHAVRRVCPDTNSLPPAPNTMIGFTFEDANNIEKILLAAYEGMENSYRSGELYSGEV